MSAFIEQRGRARVPTKKRPSLSRLTQNLLKQLIISHDDRIKILSEKINNYIYNYNLESIIVRTSADIV